MEQLQVLRTQGWLRFWDIASASRILGLLTIVVSGDASFDLVAASGYHDVFYHAPLIGQSDAYNLSNSYYGSSDLKTALGKVSSRLTSSQVALAKEQVAAAQGKGIVARYWDTSTWPVNVRDRFWEDLHACVVGMLNIDKVDIAARLDRKVVDNSRFTHLQMKTGLSTVSVLYSEQGCRFILFSVSSCFLVSL
jgi:hypothetical protein